MVRAYAVPYGLGEEAWRQPLACGTEIAGSAAVFIPERRTGAVGPARGPPPGDQVCYDPLKEKIVQALPIPFLLPTNCLPSHISSLKEFTRREAFQSL